MEDWAREFERLCRARIAEEHAPDSAFADLQPVLLFLDPARFGVEWTTVPALIRQRFQARPLRQVLSLSPDDPELDPFMDHWQRRQFRELGYALTVLVHLPLQHIPRGRRALAPVELALREALQLWTFALIPAIEEVYSQNDDLREGYADKFDIVARHGPNLAALAEASTAGTRERRNADADDERNDNPALRPYAGAEKDDADASAPPEDNAKLRRFLEAQMDEGRKIRILIADGKAVHEYQGETMRRRAISRVIAARGRNRGASQTAALVRRYVELLDLLAKARRAAAAIMSARPGEMRDYTEGMDRLDGLGAHGLRRDPSGQGKRRLAAANAINAAQKPDALIQPPILDAAIRFSPQELAALAFLCDIDPFHICAQYHLLCPEILAARALGAMQFQRRDEARDAVEPLLPWLRTSGAPRNPGANPIETGARDIAAAIVGLRNLLIEE